MAYDGWMDENPYQSPQGKGAGVPDFQPWAMPGMLTILISVLLFGTAGSVLIASAVLGLMLLTGQPLLPRFAAIAPKLCVIGIGASFAMIWLGIAARRSSSARFSRADIVQMLGEAGDDAEDEEN